MFEWKIQLLHISEFILCMFYERVRHKITKTRFYPRKQEKGNVSIKLQQELIMMKIINKKDQLNCT